MKTQLLILLLAVVLSACSSTATPNPPTIIPTRDPKALASELDGIVQKNNQDGVFDGAILVAQNGQVILSQGYGYADRFKQIPNTAQTKFRIASITKQFTAMAILILQEQGKLNVQDKLCTYISDCPEIFEPVTLHHLLTHSSGIPNTTSWSQPGDKMLSKSATLTFQPGELFSYSDVGFNLLGKVIENVSGQSYETFVQQNIFEPLQMSRTGYGLQEADLAKGYSTGQGDIAQYNTNDYYAAGALYSTVEDLYRWDQALYTDKLLPQSMLSAMFASQMPVPDGQYYGIYGRQGWNYGYGWFVWPGEPRLILHGGTLPGFRTEIRRYPDDKTTIILLCNQEAVMLEPTADAIAAKLLGEEYRLSTEDPGSIK